MDWTLHGVVKSAFRLMLVRWVLVVVLGLLLVLRVLLVLVPVVGCGFLDMHTA